MRKFWRAVPFCLIALTVAVAVAATPAQPYSRSEYQQSSSEHMTKGELLKVDTTNSVFTIKQESGEEMQFQYDSSTKVEGSQDGVQGLSSNSGTRVAVHYKEQSGHRVATRIEILKSDG